MTKSELLTELDNRISAAKVSGFWTPGMKEEWIYQSIVKACNFESEEARALGYGRWKFLEKAKLAKTIADHEYYDQPEDFEDNSIYMIKVDGDEYDVKPWDEYQALKDAESTAKMASLHERFFFINPTPIEGSDDYNVDIYGILKPKKTDTQPITPSEFDEPIVRLALATCLQKEKRYDEATAETAGAERILARLEKKMKDKGKMGYVGQARSSRWSG